MPNGKYDINRLNDLAKELKCKLIGDYSSGKLYIKTMIEGFCTEENCDGRWKKIFFDLQRYKLPLCEFHLNLHRKQVFAKTCLDKFGTDNPAELDYLQKKRIQTNLAIHGRKGSTPSIYNYDLLCKLIDELNFEFVKRSDGELTSMTIIYGKCDEFYCDETWERTFITLYKYRTVKCDTHTKLGKLVKSEQTNMSKYGQRNPMQSPEIKQYSQERCFMIYGVRHVMQDAEFSEYHRKLCFKPKEFKFPSGNIVMVQGYEPFALEKLIEDGIEEDDILTSRTEVPEIWYEGEDDKEHRYYADIYLPFDNKIIEVKSPWTLERDKEENIRKMNASREAGFDFEFWVFDRKKESLEIITDLE